MAAGNSELCQISTAALHEIVIKQNTLHTIHTHALTLNHSLTHSTPTPRSKKPSIHNTHVSMLPGTSYTTELSTNLNSIKFTHKGLSHR